MKVSSVALDPIQPVRQQDQKVLFTGVADEQVTGGTIHMTIKYAGFLPVYDHVWNICDLEKCPVGPGVVNVTLLIPGSSIPSASPPGTYNTHTVAVDQAGLELTCVDLAFKL